MQVPRFVTAAAAVVAVAAVGIAAPGAASAAGPLGPPAGDSHALFAKLVRLADANAAAHRRGPVARRSVVGGYLPGDGQWPWAAFLLVQTSNASWTCGGTIIGPQTILTAAHCVVDEKTGAQIAPQDAVLTLGIRDLRTVQPANVVRASAVRVHPGAARTPHGALTNDVALITLAVPTSLPAATLVAPGEEALWAPGLENLTVMGWGLTGDNAAEASPALLAADVVRYPDDACARGYAPDFDTTTMLCAGDPRVQRGSCKGDSGGGLMATPDRGRTWRLVGVVSWGAGVCSRTDAPSVYARVASPGLRNWILSGGATTGGGGTVGGGPVGGSPGAGGTGGGTGGGSGPVTARKVNPRLRIASIRIRGGIATLTGTIVRGATGRLRIQHGPVVRASAGATAAATAASRYSIRIRLTRAERRAVRIAFVVAYSGDGGHNAAVVRTTVLRSRVTVR